MRLIYRYKVDLSLDCREFYYWYSYQVCLVILTLESNHFLFVSKSKYTLYGAHFLSIICMHMPSMLTLSGSTKLEGLPKDYSPSVVGAVYSSTHGSTFSFSQRMAASRAVLRHHQHLKDHFNTRTPSGLHPWYVALNGSGAVSSPEQQEVNVLHKETLHDLFDSVHSSVITFWQCSHISFISDYCIKPY